MTKDDRFREWLRSATPPDPVASDVDDAFDEPREPPPTFWDRVYHPFITTMQQWIDLNA